MWRQNILKNASSIYFPLCPPTISKLARGQSDDQSEERRKKEKKKNSPLKKSRLSLSLSVQKEEEERIAGGLLFVTENQRCSTRRMIHRGGVSVSCVLPLVHYTT